jgi:hypothetical protein
MTDNTHDGLTDGALVAVGAASPHAAEVRAESLKSAIAGIKRAREGRETPVAFSYEPEPASEPHTAGLEAAAPRWRTAPLFSFGIRARSAVAESDADRRDG